MTTKQTANSETNSEVNPMVLQIRIFDEENQKERERKIKVNQSIHEIARLGVQNQSNKSVGADWKRKLKAAFKQFASTEDGDKDFQDLSEAIVDGEVRFS